MKDASDFMEDALNTFREREKVYGKNYYDFGTVMQDLFPKGIQLKSVSDWQRMGVLVQIVSKLTRYANNFSKGGHEDSVHDMGVYSFMLQELDALAKESGQ